MSRLARQLGKTGHTLRSVQSEAVVNASVLWRGDRLAPKYDAETGPVIVTTLRHFVKRSKELAAAVASTNGSHVILGMGHVEDGKEFARKIRLDLERYQLLVDAGPRFEMYKLLNLIDPQTLSKMYLETVNLTSVMSAVRSLLDGQLPSIGKGGSLTQLGGTYILNGGNGKPEPEVLFEHIDTMTGVHAPVEAMIAVLEDYSTRTAQ